MSSICNETFSSPVRMNLSPIKRQEIDDSFDSSFSHNHESKLVSNSNLTSSLAQSAFSPFETAKVRPVKITQNISDSLIQPRRKVNFHSIDDLVGNSENDSGYLSTVGLNTPVNQRYSICPIQEADKENSLLINKNLTPVKSECKKYRTTFTDLQKNALDVFYRHNPYPDPKEAEELSQQLGLAENVIKVWFQNKRSRDKQRKVSKQAVKQQQQQNINYNSQNSENLYSPLVANLQLLASRLQSTPISSFYSKNLF